MKSRLGIHLPNGGFHGMWALDSFHWNAFVALHLNRNLIPEIREHYPDALVLVRHYLENWYASDPHRVALDIADWYPSVKAYTRHITFANEQNLASEGAPYGGLYPPDSLYEKINEWNLAVVKELRRLCPDAVIHFPALSQGHSDDQNDFGYVGFEICRPAVEACDYLDVHTYWNGAANREDIYYGRRYRKARALFPNKRMFISECGSDVSMQRDDGADYVAWLNGLEGYVEGACFFIWDSDVANAGWTIWNKSGITSAFKHYVPPVSPAPEPTPAPVTSRPRAMLIALLRAFEKFSPKWYDDGKGHKSIGYGHQGTPEEIRLWTAPMQRWQAVEVLNRDVERYIRAVDLNVTVPVSDAQWIALCSLCFNIGVGAFSSSDLLEKLNRGDRVGAASEFERWVYSGSVVMPGLVERRNVERDLFEAG